MVGSRWSETRAPRGFSVAAGPGCAGPLFRIFLSMPVQTLVIGAGPAGLAAARALARQGNSVAVLEARDRIGGRIHTLRDPGGMPLEGGAEFVHGAAPLTRALLKEAALSTTPTGGVWVQAGKNLEHRADANKAWPGFLKKLQALKEDATLQAFLDAHYAGPRHAALRSRALRYAEGFDTADPARASARALGEEWSADGEEDARMAGGYGALVEHLRYGCGEAGVTFHLSRPVNSIRLTHLGIEAHAAGEVFTAAQAVLAVPLGVLQRPEAAALVPSAAYRAALGALGMGSVVKVVLCFREAFWETLHPGLGFLLSDEAVPTWWTQAPERNGVLTGWIAGSAAQAFTRRPAAEVQAAALRSLSEIFGTPQHALEDLLTESHVFDWSADQYALGSYAYTTVTVEARTAQAVLARPLEGKLAFAGEYRYGGPAMGTVEAALQSAADAVRALAASN